MAEGWAETPGVHLELGNICHLLWRRSVLPKIQVDRLQSLNLCSSFL